MTADTRRSSTASTRRRRHSGNQNHAGWHHREDDPPIIGGTYEGKLSADGKTITGTWTQGPNPLPLTLTRATPETEWTIPPPTPKLPPMAANANPSFEVATIKPSKPDDQRKAFWSRDVALRSSTNLCSDPLLRLRRAGQTTHRSTGLGGDGQIRYRRGTRRRRRAQQQAMERHDPKAGCRSLQAHLSSR